MFEGMVIGMHRGGARATFTVRKVSFGQGVERIFPLHSPIIDKIDVVRTARVRRAKLYFLRDLKGKAARMKEQKKPAGLDRAGPGARLAHGQGPRLQDAREHHPAHGLQPRRRRGRGRPRLPGRPGRRRGGGARSRTATCPRICDSKTVTALERERLYDRITRAAVAWGVAAADPRRDRHASTSTRRRCARCSARCWRCVRCPDFVLVDAFRIPDLLMAQRAVDARRHPLHGDRGGVDRRQGDARSDDARAARAAIPATASIGTRATRRAITSTRCRASAIPTCTGVRSGRRRCLIGWSLSVGSASHRRSRLVEKPVGHRPRRHAEKGGKAAPPGDASTPAIAEYVRVVEDQPRRLEHRQHPRRPVRRAPASRHRRSRSTRASPSTSSTKASTRRPRRSTRRSSRSSPTTRRRS